MMTQQEPRNDDSLYITEQIHGALGELNRYYTWLALGRTHEPTDDECLHHWAEHGGARAFHAEHSAEFIAWQEGRQTEQQA